MKGKYNKTWLGFTIGVLAPIVTFSIAIRFSYPMEFLDDYSWKLWLPMVAPRILSLSVIPNLAFFFLFLQTDSYSSARGVLGATVGFAILVFILRFST